MKQESRNKLSVIVSESFDPYENLALEKFLLENVIPGQVFLYLWCNERTVVCGRNQNIWKECRVDALKKDGGHPARRLSGGGAVYHDKGNLNFTFIACQGEYSLERQLQVIIEAARSFGIDAVKTGRNDITVSGGKFSGNAFYKTNPNNFADRIVRLYHHGTLMVEVDKEILSAYLNPDKEKYASKGVDSVKSRVCNLKEFNSAVTVPAMAGAMVSAFEKVYRADADIWSFSLSGAFAAKIMPAQPRFKLSKSEEECISRGAAFFASDEWLYRNNIKFNARFSRRFDFGDFDLRIFAKNGVILDAAVYSDAMDGEWVLRMEQRIKQLEGENYSIEALRTAIADESISEALFEDA